MLNGELRRRTARVPEHGHDGPHDHPHDHNHHDHEHAPGGEHAHGGVGHAHVPTGPGSTITWRGLFALGLAGGLIPSTSALLILLGSIAAGRPAFGLVLVVAFGIGMAAVMAGIGLAIVVGRDRLDRVEIGGGLERARATIPLAAALLVTGFGAWLTIQSIAGAPTL